jgi:hypothetical protein
MALVITAGSSFAAAPSFTFKGTVINSDGDPEPGVMIVLSFTGVAATDDNLAGDTVCTDTHGVFAKSVAYNSSSIPADSFVVLYILCQKTGYIKTNGWLYVKANDTIDLGVRHLVDCVFKDIALTGKIVDSTTGNGISGAKLNCCTMTSGMVGDETCYYFSPWDTFTSGGDGTIAGTLHALQDGITIIYSAQHNNCVTTTGNVPLQASGGERTLDPIKMRSNNVTVRHGLPTVRNADNGRQDAVAVYSLNGACLYRQSKGIPVTTLKKMGLSASGTYIIRHSDGRASTVSGKKIGVR